MTVKTNNVQKGGGWLSNNNNITIKDIIRRIDKEKFSVVYDNILERREIKKAFPKIHEITPYDGTFLRKDVTDLKRDIIIADTFSKCAVEYEKESGEYLFDNSCQELVQIQVNKDFPLVHRLINYDDFYIRWWFALYSEDDVLDENAYNYFRNAIIWKVKSFPKYDEMCKRHLPDKYITHCKGIGIAKIYEDETIKDLTTTNYSIKLKQKQLEKRRHGGKKSRKSRNKKRKSNKKKRKTVKKRKG